MVKLVNSKTVTVKIFIPIIDTGTGTAKGRGGGKEIFPSSVK